MMVRKCRLLPVLFCVAAAAYGQTAPVDPAAYLDDVKFLASPELRGRASGSPQLEKAADFIVAKYRGFGIQPPPGSGYLQAFTVMTGSTLGPGNRLDFTE